MKPPKKKTVALPVSPQTVLSSAATLFFLRRGHRSGPDFDARRQHSGFHVAPQRDQQLPRQGDDGDPERAPLQGANALAEPSSERAARLVAQPQPGELDKGGTCPRIACAANAPVSVHASALVGHGGHADITGKLTAVCEGTVEHPRTSTAEKVAPMPRTR